MKRTLLCFITILCCITATAQKVQLDPLFAQLRSAIDSVAVYDSRQEKKIAKLKSNYSTVLGTDKSKAQALCTQIFESYSKFCYDSATVYIAKSIQLAQEIGDKTKELEARILQARYYGKGGSCVEAIHLINTIDEDAVPQSLLPLFYDAVRAIYIEAGNSLRHPQLRQDYLDKSRDYREKLYATQDSTAFDILMLREAKSRYDQKFDEALALNDRQLKLAQPETRRFSEVAFFRSCTYRDMGNIEMQKYWLLLSCLGDLRHSIKDQASLWTLAEVLAGEGDTELSYLLIRTSHEGLSMYNAPLRYLQSVNVLSMIDHNYQIMTNDQNTKLRLMLWLISILALLLLGATGYIYRQMKRLSMARQQLHTANEELQGLNAQLASTVESLNVSNEKLSESNTIKDVYIGRFLALCSEYMKKMESFRSTVLKKEKSGQLEEYLSKSRMKEIKAKEVAEFTTDFDEAFLHIVPTFIEEFNALLKPDKRIVPPKEFTLTTELRIFALIRLGINDSSKIAEFLHYSVQTIYNYRSSVKNNAIGERDDFEDRVRKIGTDKHGSKMET